MGEAWINGSFCDEKDLSVSAKDVGILRGYGVFDYLRTYGGEPFHLKDHIRRFFRSAEMLHLEVGYSQDEVEAVVRELVRRNGYPESSLRLVCLGGESPTAMIPEGRSTLYLMADPFPGDRKELESWQEEGISLISFPHLRYRAEAKTNNYIPAMDALREARSRGAFDALFCGTDGEIYETTRANVFFRRNGKWLTPPGNILIGITRRVVMSLMAPEEQVEEALYLKDLPGIEEAFLTSSSKEIVPIIQIDDTPVGDGKPGPCTKALIKKFNAYIADPALWAKNEEEHPYGTV